MAFKLDSKKIYKKFDSGLSLDSIKNLAKQCRQAHKEIDRVKIPNKYRKVDKITVLGMGGSNIGSDFIRSVFADDLKIPLQIIADYNLPDYVDGKSLVIASSYSGNTEETLNALTQALSRRSQVFVITTGGKLSEAAKKYRLPSYIFKPFYNSSGQPRMALGYSVTALMGIFRKTNLLNITKLEIQKAIDCLEEASKKFHETIKTKNNPAKNLAQKIQKKIPILFTSNPFLGNAHIFSNQLNENAKNFATFFAIPELNHHLLEGLTHPKALRYLSFVLLESDMDSHKIKKRFTVTKKVLLRKKLEINSVKILGPDRLSKSLWLLSFGGFVSFYLAMLNREDPYFIPWVDFFKKELER